MLKKLAYVVAAMAVVIAVVHLMEHFVVETDSTEGGRGQVVTEVAVSSPEKTTVDGAAESGTRAVDVSQRGGSRSSRSSTVADGLENHVVRQWKGQLDPAFSAVAAAYREDGQEVFSLATFDGGRVDIHIQQIERVLNGRGEILRGTVVSEAGSLVSLSRVGESHSGSILIPSRGLVYEVRPAPGGDVIFSEVDTAVMGDCQHCLEVSQPTAVSLPSDFQ